MTPARRRSIRAASAIVWALLLQAAASTPLTASGLARVSQAPDACIDIRQEASAESTAHDCLPGGTLVVVLAVIPGWREVLADDGRRGWIEEGLLETTPATTGEGTPEAVPAVGAEPVVPAPAPAAGDAAAAEELAASAHAAEIETLTRERDDLRLRLGAAEAQIAALRADLQAAQTALESLQAESAELGSGLAGARAEIETLKEQLRSSEGRQIFLVSELEKSRAEVRRLEREAALATPPPAPPLEAPIPTPAEPPPTDPSPVDPAPAEPDAPAATETAGPPQQEILEMLRSWAQSWSEQRVDDYLSFYSSEFRPADGLARSDWESLRRLRILQPRSIEVSLERTVVEVEGDLARAGFLQSYRSDRFSDAVSKILLLRREAGSWKILEETVAP